MYVCMFLLVIWFSGVFLIRDLLLLSFWWMEPPQILWRVWVIVDGTFWCPGAVHVLVLSFARHCLAC